MTPSQAWNIALERAKGAIGGVIEADFDETQNMHYVRLLARMCDALDDLKKQAPRERRKRAVEQEAREEKR